MEARSNSFGLMVLGIALAIGMVMSATLVADAMLEVKRANQALEVKGFAERAIESDFATWSASFATRADALTGAYATLESDREKVAAFLGSHGVGGDALRWMPVSMMILYGRDEKGMMTNEVEGYQLSQSLEVGGADIDLIARLSQESSALVKAGVEFSSSRPQYLYTKLGELKIEMLAEATADARRRAETLARESGGSLGRLLSARQGVFQITAEHSTEVSDYGRNDTSSRDKSIKAVVTVRFAVGR